MEKENFTAVEISRLREEIDGIDQALAALLLERSLVVREIHRLKRREDIPIFDRTREEKIVARLQTQFPELNPSLIAGIFEVIFSASK